ncbi:MAG: hypothetical protein P8L85_12875 [Rubripirellula sp.]|nr:hypothetical protein [Rubripirellula sp.]
MSLNQQCAKLAYVIEGFAVGQVTRRINRQILSVLGPPSTNGVEVLQGESQRVDLTMALGAGSDAAMLCQLFADGQGTADVRLDLGDSNSNGFTNIEEYINGLIPND